MGAQVFDGDKDLPEDEQTQGFAARGEYNVFDTVRVGLNYMQDGDDDSTKYMKAFLTKAKVGEASSIMVEAGLVDKRIKGRRNHYFSVSFYAESHLHQKRSLLSHNIRKGDSGHLGQPRDTTYISRNSVFSFSEFGSAGRASKPAHLQRRRKYRGLLELFRAAALMVLRGIIFLLLISGICHARRGSALRLLS